MRRNRQENIDGSLGQDIAAPKGSKKAGRKIPKPPKEFNRSFSDIFHSRIVIGFICVFAALAVAFIALPMVQTKISERVPVVILRHDLEKGTLLTADMLSISEISAIDRPPNAAVSLNQVIGSYTGMDMLRGDLVVSSKLSRERPLANPYLYDLPMDKSAISITVHGLAEGLSGKLKPGDIVTIYAVFNRSSTDEGYMALQPQELKYVKVLAVSNASGNDIDADDLQNMNDGNANRERLPAAITLLVCNYQAAALAGLDRNATIHAALAARANDPETVNAMLLMQDEYIESLTRGEEENDEEEDEDNTAEDHDGVEGDIEIAGDEDGAHDESEVDGL